MIPYFSIIPYAYFLHTRLKGKFQQMSWIFVYFIPLTFLFIALCERISVNAVMVFVLGFLIVNYVYENGYIQNDVRTIRMEKEPTLRLTAGEEVAISSRYWSVVAVRVLILTVFFALYVVCIVLAPRLYSDRFGLPIAAVILQGCYICYNRIRGRTNLAFIPIMAFIRFYGPLLPFVATGSLLSFVILGMLIYPVPKLLEFCKRKRYGFPGLSKRIGNIDHFRVKYYLMLSLLFLVVSLFNRESIYLVYLLVSVYYLVFRVLGLAALKKAKVGVEFKDNFGRE